MTSASVLVNTVTHACLVSKFWWSTAAGAYRPPRWVRRLSSDCLFAFLESAWTLPASYTSRSPVMYTPKITYSESGNVEAISGFEIKLMWKTTVISVL